MCPTPLEDTQHSQEESGEASLTEEEEADVISDAKKVVSATEEVEDEAQADSVVKDEEFEGADSSEQIKKGQEKYYGI